MHVFLDESGNLTGKNNSNYFVVGTHTTDDPRKIVQEFRKWQFKKFPKKLKNQTEIKFTDNSINHELRLKTLNFISNLNLKIYYTFLKKKNIPIEYRKGKEVKETGILYAEIVSSTLELYLPFEDGEFRIYRDQRSTKALTSTKFNEYLKLNLLPKLPAKTVFEVMAVDSTTNINIQISDWICGALANYYEKKKFGDKYYSVISKNIVNYRELFSEYWSKKWQNHQ